jgi:hypothetical protein
MRNIPNLFLVLQGLTLRVWPGLLTHAVLASFAQNDVKNTAQWRERGATI